MQLQDFYRNLQLRVGFVPVREQQVEKIAQLTKQTADFHLTGRVHSPVEIRELSGDPDWLALGIEVSDRFGDYGMSGAVLASFQPDELVVDTFCLSCRVLGKGVEEAVLRQLAEAAKERGLSRVRLVYRKTPRNALAGAFVKKTGDKHVSVEENGWSASVPVDELMRTDGRKADVVEGKPQVRGTADAPFRLFERRWKKRDASALMPDIALRLRSGEEVLAAIREKNRQLRPELDSVYVAPRTPTEEQLAQLWAEVLGIERVGVYDHFLKLGGHSLLGTRLVSRIREAFEVDLPLRSLFEAPTVAGLAEKIDQVKSRERGMETPPIRPVPRGERIPLSFSQKRLWFLDRLQPGTVFYNMPAAVRMTGSLDVAALKRSLDEIVRRHESLRTTFAAVEGEPVQVIQPPRPQEMAVIDLRSLPEGEREEKVRQLAREEAEKPFDLSRGPLMRVTLLKLAPEEHVLLLTMHHIVSDGWSLGVLVREIAALYEAFRNGRPSPLPELPVQYADYACWQEQLDEVLKRQLDYWKQQLAGLVPLQLPTDRSRPAVQTFRGARKTTVLPRELLDKLHRLSREEGATLFMTLLAAFKVLLHRYTGQDDLAVGTPIAGRNRAETESMIGFFINTLVMRTRLSGELSFRELLGRVRETTLEAYVHQDLPFEKLVEELDPDRDMSRNPLVQVMFFLLNTPMPDLELPGLKLSLLEVESRTAKFDLDLSMRETEEGLIASLEYNTDLFEEGTIRRLLDHFRRLLEGIVTDPGCRIADIPLTAENERRLLSDGNRLLPERTGDPFTIGAEATIPGRFVEQVRKDPDRIAVRTKTGAWTYGELDRAANRTARTLLGLQREREERVALLLDPDGSMFVAILGVLKAGKTYIPVDPHQPEERMALILEDADPHVLLTCDRHEARARELSNGRFPVINVDRLQPGVPDDPVDAKVSPDAVAYILYTSGSTGKPKGVMQSHRNVLHHIGNYTRNLRIGADDRLTMLPSYSFDAAVMDMYGALLNGATLYPVHVKEEGVAGLAEWLAEQKITIYHSTPTLYRSFVLTLTGTEDLSSIRLVVLGGEEVTKRDVELFKRHFAPDSLFVNGLGPTECTVALQHFLDHRTGLERNTIPVGTPVDGIEVLLLNEFGRPGEVRGEIAYRSPHVALGYWRNEEATRSAFLPDPEGGDRRIYRTGDLGRLTADGLIEFLGRKDAQVKIRGYRIETGEIETKLLEHPALREAAVAVRKDPRGEDRLVAWLVAEPGLSVPTTRELRDFLRQKLPDYMIPSAFVTLDRLPLTPTGKVDRRALIAPDRFGDDSEQEYVAPKTEAERKIAAIWQEALGVERVGIQHNFFDLGGHSLLMIRIHNRLQQAFEREISLIDLFRHPTVASLARHLTEEAADRESKHRQIEERAQKQLTVRAKQKQRRQIRG